MKSCWYSFQLIISTKLYQKFRLFTSKAKFAMHKSRTHGTSLFAKAPVPKFCLTTRGFTLFKPTVGSM